MMLFEFFKDRFTVMIGAPVAWAGSGLDIAEEGVSSANTVEETGVSSGARESFCVMIGCAFAVGCTAMYIVAVVMIPPVMKRIDETRMMEIAPAKPVLLK